MDPELGLISAVSPTELAGALLKNAVLWGYEFEMP